MQKDCATRPILAKKNALFEAVARKKETASDICLLIFSKTLLSSITYMNFQKMAI